MAHLYIVSVPDTSTLVTLVDDAVVVVVVVGKMGEVAGVKRMEKLQLNPAQNSLLINNCGAQGNLQLLVCR